MENNLLTTLYSEPKPAEVRLDWNWVQAACFRQSLSTMCRRPISSTLELRLSSRMSFSPHDYPWNSACPASSSRSDFLPAPNSLQPDGFPSCPWRVGGYLSRNSMCDLLPPGNPSSLTCRFRCGRQRGGHTADMGGADGYSSSRHKCVLLLHLRHQWFHSRRVS